MEPEDLEAMYRWENDTSLWNLGDNSTPFSKATLRQFIETATEDIFTTKQLRLIIEIEGRAIGTADLFDFNPLYSRAGVGILIYEAHDRGKGYATRAMKLLCDYAFSRLNMGQLYVHVPQSNIASLKMCGKSGFTQSGILRKWSGDEDVFIMQLIG